jgi:hypothetical protein
VTVIPITPLTLTTARNITGHMTPGRVIMRRVINRRVIERKVVKLGSDDSTLAGLAVPAGPRRRHALTFHRFNVLLKNSAEPPAGLAGLPAAIGGYWGLAVG